MAREITVETLARWILCLSGVVLTLAGVIGLLYDYIPDIRIEEYGSVLVLGIGATVLIVTSLVYIVVPQREEKRRLEKLRLHYKDRPHGELLNLNHNIVDAAQAAILGIELAASFSHQCLDQDATVDERRDKIAASKTSLDQVNRDIERLKGFVNEFDDYVSSRS